MTLRPQTERAVHQILDTFSGADASYLDFQTLLEVMDQRAAEGDKAAQRIVDIVLNMGRLLDVAIGQARMPDVVPAETAKEWPDYTK